MVDEKLVPKLRFSGFDDEWENVYLVHCKKHIGGIRGRCILL